jgi:hypothetical protein
VTRRAVFMANIVAWTLVLAGVMACACWLASLRTGDYVEHVTVIERFGRPGWDWYVDFLRGQMRFVVKDYDLVVLYLAVPGWIAALTLFFSGVSLVIWNRRQGLRMRGFALQSMPSTNLESRESQS